MNNQVKDILWYVVIGPFWLAGWCMVNSLLLMDYVTTKWRKYWYR